MVDEKIVNDIYELEEFPDGKANEKNREKTKAPAGSEPKPAPLEKEEGKHEKTKAPAPIPAMNEKEHKPAPANTLTAIDSETAQPTISVTSMVPTENLPLQKATYMPSEDIPLSGAPTLEPTAVLLPFDLDEVASSLENDVIDKNGTHTSLKTDASHSELVTESNLLSEVEHYVQNHHGLQYGLIAVCIVLVLAIMSMLGFLRRRAKERKKNELPVADAAGVL